MSRVHDNSWLRRRAAVSAEAEADRQAAITVARAELQSAQAEKSDADILSELSLQDPDEMLAGDDFSGFMRDEVPERLRKRALRALWRSNPVLACVDDLLEYGEDFKAEWTAGEVIRTTYQVGKGMLAHVKEMERQAEEEARVVSEAVIGPEDELGPETDMTGTDEDALIEPEAEPEQATVTIEGDVATFLPEPENEPEYVPMRRMRFEFDGVA